MLRKLSFSIFHLFMVVCVSPTYGQSTLASVVFVDPGGNVMDAGWALNPEWGAPTYIHSWSLNGGPDQQWNYTSSNYLQSVANPLMYLYDASGKLALGPVGDHFTLIPSGSGYLILDNSDGGFYISDSAGIGQNNLIPMSSIATAWTVPGTGDGATINDTDPSVVYSIGNPPWHSFRDSSGAYDQDEHSSNFQRSGGSFQGASAAVTFSGTGIKWIGKKGPNYGNAAYSIDGGAPQAFDSYNSTELLQTTNATVSGLAAGSHVLQISLLANKNPASSDYYQTIDAFQISGSPLAHASATIAGWNSPQLVFTGPWNCGGNNPTDLSDGHCWTPVGGSTLSWTFTGSLIEVFGRPDLENGYFQVSIDGNYVATVDGQFGNADDDALNSVMMFASKLSSGTHTIKLTVTGTHDSAATKSYVQIDEFAAFP